MLVWRCKSHNVSLPFSIGTFVKHLPFLLPKPRAFVPRRIKVRTLSTDAIRNSSHFETLNSRQRDQIHRYVDALLQWNQKMNLTAVTEVEEVMERHIEDSLVLISPIMKSYTTHCNASIDNVKLVDVGTGPGLPGLVLAIACPDWKVTLLESMNKRCVFLDHAVSVTGVSNVEVVRGRAEGRV
uniref:Methyltransferase gidB n=1 Tax=Rhizophora mucronata TaxID=61149 RepID=A0A2P2JCH0_RHIMU